MKIQNPSNRMIPKIQTFKRDPKTDKANLRPRRLSQKTVKRTVNNQLIKQNSKKKRLSKSTRLKDQHLKLAPRLILKLKMLPRRFKTRNLIQRRKIQLPLKKKRNSTRSRSDQRKKVKMIKLRESQLKRNLSPNSLIIKTLPCISFQKFKSQLTHSKDTLLLSETRPQLWMLKRL